MWHAVCWSLIPAYSLVPTEADWVSSDLPCSMSRAQAEKMNSRAAMIGFFSLLAVEAIAGKGLLELLGLNIGKGLNIGL